MKARLRFMLGVLAAYWLRVTDFLHGPPRPWRSRTARRDGLLLGDEAADAAVKAFNNLGWTPGERLAVTKLLDELVELECAPEPTYPNRGSV